ncbi:MAG: hypothetical protein N3E37_02740, partial [Candidatus Micrarchaeota archaeon]|nr:hypothetical protein [Candidatus Micrarchaeota archaeon]
MKLDPSINDYSDDDFGLSSEKENKPKHPSEDYGLKHRMYSRMINEIISQEKKLNNILNNRLDLKKIAQKLDYTQINKKAKLTRELLKILTSELNESRIDYDFVIDLCNVLSPNLQIQDKRQLIEKLFHNDYNVIRVNDFFDELERDNLNIAIEVINPLD